MKTRRTLDGNWTLTDQTDRKVYEIPRMPMQVHTILHEKGEISDRYIWGDSSDCDFITEHTYAYETRFEQDTISPLIYLYVWGIDTIADIYLNGQLIGHHDNYFLPCRIRISDALVPGENHLKFVFPPIREEVRKVSEWNPRPGRIEDFRMLRKSFHDFTQYLGGKPDLPRVGIFSDVVIETVDEAEITRLDVYYELNDALDKAGVELVCEASGDCDLNIRIEDPDGKTVYDGPAGTKICLENIRLWNPRGFGDQCRYKVLATAGKDGRILDTCEKYIGFRKVDTVGNLNFVINHRQMYLYGACFTPIEGESAVLSEERLLTILHRAYDCNMNTLRIWGEGERLPQSFYDEADRLGMLIWQEFFSGNAMYPNLEWYRDQMRKEAENLVRTLRNHPCILFWCGGNETYLNRDFGFPDEEYLGCEICEHDYRQIVAKLDPDRFYFVTSPFGGAYSNAPEVGDTHSYTNTWFVPGGDYPNFVSENLRVALPVAHSMRKYLKVQEDPKADSFQFRPGDFPWPKEWNYLTSADAWDKIPEVERYYDAGDFRSLIYRFGAAAGDYLRDAVERYRRGKHVYEAFGNRHCMGHLVWKLNTTRPHLYSSVLDYYLEPYIPYYRLRAAYEPVLVSFEVGDHIYAWIVNDSAKAVTGTLKISLFDTQKNAVDRSFVQPVRVVPGASALICNLDEFGQFPRRMLIVGELRDENGQAVTCVSRFADIERHLRFPDAAVEITKEGEDYVLRTDKYAHCVELSGESGGDESGFFFSDNYFSLLPGQEKRVRLASDAEHGTIRVKAHYSSQINQIIF